MLSTIEGKICALILLVFVSPVNGRQKGQGRIKVQLRALVVLLSYGLQRTTPARQRLIYSGRRLDAASAGS